MFRLAREVGQRSVEIVSDDSNNVDRMVRLSHLSASWQIRTDSSYGASNIDPCYHSVNRLEHRPNKESNPGTCISGDGNENPSRYV
jgi:hypothetical protein